MPAMKRPVDLEPAELERRFPRRFLFAGAAGAAAAAVAVTAGAAEPAAAASATTPWMLGGNTGVTTSNFLGPTTSGAALIFKTKANTSSAVSEKMRLTPQGRLGLGVTAPAARVDAVSSSIGIKGTSTSTASDGRGVQGSASDGYGVEGTSKNYMGLYGTGGYAGCYASGTTYGVIGTGSGAGSYGGYFSGVGYGAIVNSDGYGLFAASGNTAIYASGGTAGVVGVVNNNAGNAVSGNGGQYAVRGVGAYTAGVRGDSNYVGVWGEATTFGVFGTSTATSGQTYGVYGSAASPAGYAIYASGRMHVNGTLSKSAGSFKIDHPLDPDNQWLSHSFVESPDMMNVYNGNVTTDADGQATVELPSYFEALNRDFRYQLTVIGVFAQAIVSRKVADGSFAVATDKPNVEVSWQITGIRQDSYAAEHPIIVEEPKTDLERGSGAAARGSGPGSSATAPFSPPQAAESEPPADPGPVPKPELRPQTKPASPSTAP
ncbi:hypothetical protein NVV95_06640 [Herbiconiux sp. CPCC 205716]|uniref:Uncharacterized protein n=1 Tax=Herbiconiux gentiana TaxID=2970912 RepID=A0ABT2GH47_9MICO|nr:hypothetical protein [Herbiconiux gentiana]MCS5714229.1 hypothetical protein [Herbiconiux gentiana]